MTQAATPPTPAAKTEPDPEPARAFLVSSAPHLAAGLSSQRIMFEVVAAMLPMFIVGLILFRQMALVITVATVASCLVTEAIANKLRGQSLASLKDGSAIVTGMILAFSLPPAIDWYKAVIGGVVAIALAKAVFGGLGQNLFNPAMVGRAFLMVCFPAAMGAWTEPMTLKAIGAVDTVTMATPLTAAAEAGGHLPNLWSLFIGNVGGCIGETSTLAVLIGGIYLLIRGIADWRQPLGVLSAAAVFATIAHLVAPDTYEGPLFELTSGALMFGALFIATDYVGAPVTPRGRLVFGIGVGLLVMVIRLFGAYPEGVMFAILIMNALTPLIERWTIPTPFGGHVPSTPSQ